MALIQCPGCNKRMSDTMAECPHCQFKIGGLSDAERNEEMRRLAAAKREKLLSQSMLALLIAIAAFTYYFVQQPLPKSLAANISYALMVIGLVWFVVNRIRLIFVKRALKR